MDGHSRSGAFGEEGARESDDPFDRMRSFGSLGRGADMFSHPGWSGFTHGAAGDSWSMVSDEFSLITDSKLVVAVPVLVWAPTAKWLWFLFDCKQQGLF